MKMDDDGKRLISALEFVSPDKSVMAINVDDWHDLVRRDGVPTIIEKMPPGAEGIMRMASLVAVAGSGIANQSPGIQAIRFDENDAPTNYNLYNFTVLEYLPENPIYIQAIEVAGVEDTEELRESLRENVFIVSEKNEDEHWFKEIPQHIREAKRKDDD